MTLDQSAALAAAQRLYQVLPVRNCGDMDDPDNWAESDRPLSPSEREILNRLEEQS